MYMESRLKENFHLLSKAYVGASPMGRMILLSVTAYLNDGTTNNTVAKWWAFENYQIVHTDIKGIAI